MRKGNVLVLAAGCLVLVFGFVAFSVDLGYITLTKAELQKTADGSSLGSAIELMDGLGLGRIVDPATAEANARQAAGDIAAANRAGGRDTVYVDANRDVRFGNYSYDTATGKWVKSWGTAPYNMVEVTARRDENGSTESGDEPLDLFFAPVIGHNQANVEQTATAVLLPGGGFYKRPGQNIGILPLTLDKPSWDNMMYHMKTDGVGQDNYTWNEESKTITSGPDGILEVNLFPYGPQDLMPGNRGTVDFGDTGNSTADIERQILYGLNDSDWAALANQGITELNWDSGPIDIYGDTGLSAGFQDELNAIAGEPRAIPLFINISGPGNNALYTIDCFVGIRIMYANLNGKPSSKRVIVQPAPFSDFAVIPSTGPITDDSIFAPASLVP